jgi:hypothetical protein
MRRPRGGDDVAPLDPPGKYAEPVALDSLGPATEASRERVLSEPEIGLRSSLRLGDAHRLGNVDLHGGRHARRDHYFSLAESNATAIVTRYIQWEIQRRRTPKRDLRRATDKSSHQPAYVAAVT